MDQPPTKFICIFVWLIRLNVLVLVSVWIMGLEELKPIASARTAKVLFAREPLRNVFVRYCLTLLECVEAYWTTKTNHCATRKYLQQLLKKRKIVSCPSFLWTKKDMFNSRVCTETHTRMYIWKPSTLPVRTHVENRGTVIIIVITLTCIVYNSHI